MGYIVIGNKRICLINMDQNSLKQILNLLQKSKKVKKSDRKMYFQYCSDDEIHAICGACKNFLSENFYISPNRKTYLKKKLLPIKNDIRDLSKEQLGVSKKRKLLAKDQVGNGIFSLLAGVIIPSIVSALAGR